METTDISIWGLVIGLLLMALPLYLFYRFGARLVRSTVVALVRMVVQMLLIGLYLKYLFLWNNPWVNILWVLVMVLVASYTAAHRTRLRRTMFLLPLATGFFVSALLTGLYFLLFVLFLSHPFDARYFIPVMGLLMGNMLGVSVVALNTYYDGLQREHQLYEYLLGNGATHLEAITPFVRKAMEKSFAPCIANMAVMGIVALPGTMIGQILGGVAPGVAVRYQMMICVITFVAAMGAMAVTLYMADKKSFDAYGRLKTVRSKN